MRHDWILTFTGRKFYPLDPRPADVCIEDIAHALSMKCRYTGHCQHFYSVGQHSCECAIRVKREDALQALMHDAAEAYLFDLAAPIKQAFPRAIEAEQRIMRVIGEVFGFDPAMPESVHEVDRRMLVTEMRDLMTGYEQSRLFGVIDPFPEQIEPEYPKRTEQRFLYFFKVLSGR